MRLMLAGECEVTMGPEEFREVLRICIFSFVRMIITV